jgi:hypothetical protein
MPVKYAPGPVQHIRSVGYRGRFYHLWQLPGQRVECGAFGFVEAIEEKRSLG